MRQAKELGLSQPFFVGSNMVDPSLVNAAKSNAEGVVGFSLIPYLPGSKAAEMVKWEAAWKKEYPNAPAGRPNNFDLLAYGDMYVVAEAMKRAGKELATDSFIRALEGIHDATVYDGELLEPGAAFSGPAIVETKGTTTVVHPGNEARVDEYGNLLISIGETA